LVPDELPDEWPSRHGGAGAGAAVTRDWDETHSRRTNSVSSRRLTIR